MVSFSLERRAKTRQVRFLILYGGNLTLVNSFDTKFYRIIVLTLLYEGDIGIFGCAVSAIFRSVFVPKNFGFSVLVTIAVCDFCSISLSVFAKNKIGFSDLLLDAVRCFSGFLSENMRLNDLNRVHVFSDFACGFRF